MFYRVFLRFSAILRVFLWSFAFFSVFSVFTMFISSVFSSCNDSFCVKCKLLVKPDYSKSFWLVLDIFVTLFMMKRQFSMFTGMSQLFAFVCMTVHPLSFGVIH